jgi:putative transposase
MPLPTSPPIKMSAAQQEILEKISRQRTSSQQEVQRSHLLLSINARLSNTQVSKEHAVNTATVRRWRRRWLREHCGLEEIEKMEQSDMGYYLEKAIRQVLRDDPRPGAPSTFTAEQYLKIIALAVQDPPSFGRPITQWTNRELADEAIIQGIVSTISPSQVGLFLKRERNKTPQDGGLAKSQMHGGGITNRL